MTDLLVFNAATRLPHTTRCNRQGSLSVVQDVRTSLSLQLHFLLHLCRVAWPSWLTLVASRHRRARQHGLQKMYAAQGIQATGQ